MQKVNGVLLSMEQFFVCGILCSVFMFLFEKPDLHQIYLARVPILYAGIMSCGVAYTFQIVGQKDMNPAVASLILSLESVISALAGWLILKEGLTPKELAGWRVGVFLCPKVIRNTAFVGIVERIEYGGND